MVDTTVPPAPANLQATVTASNTQITLAWSPVTGLPSGVDHYNIYRNGSLYATSTTTSYTDSSGISSQAQYSYQVAAVNYDGVQGTLSLPISLSSAGIASIGTPNTTSVLVTFTEPVDPVSSQVAGNYQISGGVTVSSAVLEPDDCSVLLSTSALGAGSHTLTASNVDTAALSALPVSTDTFTYSTGSTPTTLPGPGYYAPFGPNGTWNYYETVTTATTWTAAEANAQSQTFMGVIGNLPTIRSAAEVTFLNSLMGGATSNVEYWTGLTNSTAYPGAYDYGPTDYSPLPATGIAPSSTIIPITSITYSGTTATVTTSVANGTAGPTASGEVGEQVVIAGATPALYDGTFLVTSTSGTSGNYTFTYTMSGTPTSNASGGMTATVPQRGDGFAWVDGEAFSYQNWESGQPNNSSNGIGPANYVAAVPGGGTWDDRSQTNSSYPYVIEFNTNLASPPDSGNLSVVSVQTTSTLTTIAQGISLIATPGTATVTNYTAAVADYYDPEDVATGGHFTSFPFGDSATAQTALDHDFAVQVQGTIQIVTPGTYTFDVTSSDGFQLSIGGRLSRAAARERPTAAR